MPASSSKIGVLVAQLGTPQAPTARALRPYLRQFLSDPRVIDLHPLRWYPILYLFVLTRRPARSAALYANIWTDEGSPLMVHSQAQTRGLQERLGAAYRVVLGMRYGEPSIARAVQSLEQEGVERILVFPMFPQFSCATTGSIYDAVNRAALGRRCPWFFSRKRQMPALRFVPPYADHPAYINALKQSVTEAVARLSWTPDRYLITFHGIPQRYVDEGDPYRRQCEETARQLAAALGLADDEWVRGFQSRFGKEPWLEPYTEEVLERLGGSRRAPLSRRMPRLHCRLPRDARRNWPRRSRAIFPRRRPTVPLSALPQRPPGLARRHGNHRPPRTGRLGRLTAVSPR